MKSLDFIKEAKTEVIGFRKWVKDGQPVWQIIKPDGNVEVRPRGFLEQRPPDITFVAWNNKFICPPDFSCSPQADNSPAPTANTPVATKPPAPTVDVSGSAPPPVPMSKAHIDIAAKSQGAGNKPPSSSVSGGRGTVIPPVATPAPAAKPYTGSAAAQAIQKLNPQVRDINKIFVGQELQLPDGSRYKVASGDTLDGIAAGRGRGTVTGTATKLPPNQQVDFADVQKKTDNKLLENLSPVERMQQLRSLVEAPAPNPQRTRTTAILGPDGKPIRVPTSTTIRPSPTAATYMPPTSSMSPPPAPGAQELYFGDKFYRKIGNQWHEINLADGSKKPVPNMQAALDKLAAGPKTTAQTSATAQSQPQGSIKQGISSTGKPTPGSAAAGTSQEYWDNLNRSRADQTAHVKEPKIDFDTLDPNKGIKHDPETIERIKKQKAAKNATQSSKAGRLGLLLGGGAFLASMYPALKDLWQDLNNYFGITKKYEEYFPPEERSEEDLKKDMTALWEKNVLPYMNDPEAFRRLPPQKQSELITITQQWLEVIQDPKRAESLPPHLKPQIKY